MKHETSYVVAAVAMFLLQSCGTGSKNSERLSADEQRGRLLYETACVACHTTQAHWRDKRVVRSWSDLLGQVTRWQQNAGQNWSAHEIVDVAAHLNDRFYKLPCPVAGCGGPKEISQAGR